MPASVWVLKLMRVVKAKVKIPVVGSIDARSCALAKDLR